MMPCYMLSFLVLCYFPLLLLAQSGIKQKYYGNCPLYYHCGNYGDIYFPFSNTSSCGLPLRGCDNSNTNAEVQFGETWFEILKFDTKNWEEETVIINLKDKELQEHMPRNCSSFDKNVHLFPNSTVNQIFQIDNSITLYKCYRNSTLDANAENKFGHTKCFDYDIYYGLQPEVDYGNQFPSCSKIQVPFDREHFPFDRSPNPNDLFRFLTAILRIKVNIPQKCLECYETADICSDTEEHTCMKADKKHRRIWMIILIVGSVIVGAFVIIIVPLLIFRRRRFSLRKDQSRDINGDHHSNGDLESSSLFFGIPVFGYKELEEATNNFDRKRELGEGGFGTVYYGKLQDGREVAVKRLYEHNYRRVQQFVTEIEILTRLRHRNLVTLFGCTSRHSRELLLVYEYVPNGTVACHLHGDLAKSGSLPWSMRMKIAMETASALTYLHASDIIHRDVKTNNILLDNNYSVKVADFGLSRLFPNDVTHVSTAPQGTPGYLDPEYYQCYQLTNKSDVYSFGVVLIELISSMTAVDTTRPRDDINLASIAIRKIQSSALSELVDPSLGFESNNEVRRMIVSVAELAFQCLQLNKDTRPAMDQVLRMLKRIANGRDEMVHLEEEDLHEDRISNSSVHPPPSPSPEHDEIGSLKILKPPRHRQTL